MIFLSSNEQPGETIPKKTKPARLMIPCGFFNAERISDYLKSFGRLSTRLHFWHSAWFLSLPFSIIVFIMISPPQSGQMNLCVATVVREFLLAPAILCLQKSNIRG